MVRALSSVFVVLGAAVVLLPAPAQAVPSCGGRPATIVGTTQADSLEGTPGNDVAVLGPGDDHFSGHGGNDRICGGSGSDDLYGGWGADRIWGGDDFDWVRGGPGGDLISGNAGFDLIEPGPGDDHVDGGTQGDALSYRGSLTGVRIDGRNQVATGSGRDTFRRVERYEGSSYADRIIGSDRSEDFDGGPGADRIYGRGGDDQFQVVSGRTYAGVGGDDAFIRGSGWVDLGPGHDSAVVFSGKPRVRGYTGDDFFEVWNDAAPTITAYTGYDWLQFKHRTHGDVIDLASHSGTVPAGGLNVIVGSVHDDVFRGTGGHETFWGKGGNDRLVGRGGRDFLYGDAGAHDVAYGGPGADVCRTERRYAC